MSWATMLLLSVLYVVVGTTLTWDYVQRDLRMYPWRKRGKFDRKWSIFWFAFLSIAVAPIRAVLILFVWIGVLLFFSVPFCIQRMIEGT